MKPHLLALTLAFTGTLAARPFMDVSGKVIEAEFVSLTAGVVTISKDGKPFKLPLARFSAADQAFIQEQAGKPSSSVTTPAATGKLQLAGKELTRGGAINTVEAPLSEETLKKTRKGKEVTSLKIGIALPDSFDPAVPQKVLWVSSAINNDAERTAGNLAALGGYARIAVPEGWVVIAVDTNLGNPRSQDNEATDIDMPIQHQAVAMLSAAWPGFAKSIFACAGFSGGSKASFYRVGQLATADLQVVGLFVGGGNQNLTEAAKAETKVRGGALRQVNVFVSNGKSDEIATVAMGKSVGDAAEKDFAKVRIETYDGGHSLSAEHLKTALKWFAESAKPAAK
jgi:predicted esterase